MNRQSAFAVACAVSATAALGIVASPAQAITLMDDNSIAEFDLTSQRGLFDWIVDEQDVLAIEEGDEEIPGEWFWYRVDGDSQEYSIDTLDLISSTVTDTNSDGGDDTLVALYSHSLFDLEIKWSLQGGAEGSYTSDIGEQIAITNKTGESLGLNFFEYTDFDLKGDPENDTVVFSDLLDPAVAQAFIQTDGGAEGGIVEIAFDSEPAIAEAAFFDHTLNKLKDDNVDDLNDNREIGPGDVTASWQWVFDIDAGDTVQISKDKQVSRTPIPEPGTVTGLLALGSLSFGAMLKRNFGKKA